MFRLAAGSSGGICDQERCPLLRSLARRSVAVTIHIALLTELLSSRTTPQPGVKDPCKVQRGLPHSTTLRDELQRTKIR